MTHYDIAIVGGGFAGLACAQVAAQLGLRVVVLERKTDPGVGVHTTGILVQETVEEWVVPSSVTRSISDIRLYSPALRHYDLHSPNYRFLATDTPNYLRHLASEAEAHGARLLLNQPYVGATAVGEVIHLANLDISCRYLIGADGARSQVAQDFGLGLNHHFLIGVEAEYEGIGNLDENKLHCFLDAELARGYIAWVVPGVRVVQVGLACTAPAHPDLDAFIKRLSGLFDFTHARVVGRRGGLIPVGGRVNPFSRPHVFLLGDAAGVVSPLTAGGIYTALAAGRCSAEAIYQYLNNAGPEPSQVLNRLYPNFFWKQLLRTALDQGPPNWLMERLFFNPLFQSLAQIIFFHHRGLFSPAAWQAFAISR